MAAPLDHNEATSASSEATSGINEVTSGISEATSPEASPKAGSPVSRTEDLPPLEPSSALDLPEWRRLWEETRRYREQGARMKPELRRRLILQLCGGRFLSKQELAQLFGMYAKGLRDRFLTPMFKEGLLHHRYPNIPNHENQGYRAVKSDASSE